MFFYNTFVSLRQPLSILIFWFSIDLLRDKKYIKYFIMCVIAFFFHRGSIILFLVLLITCINLPKKAYLITLGVGLVCFGLVKLNILNIGSIVIGVLNLIFKSDSSALNRIIAYGSEGTQE